MELTAENVQKVLFDCFYDERPEDISVVVQAHGVLTKVGLVPEKVAEHTPEIEDMLSQLPKEFTVEHGGGMSFLNMCQRADGVQWADEHTRVEMLLLLGLAAKKLEYCMPRELWSVLPGGMPYIMIKK